MEKRIGRQLKKPPDSYYPMDSQRILKTRGVIPLVVISATYPVFSYCQKCLDLIFIYLSGLMISIGNLRPLNYVYVANKEARTLNYCRLKECRIRLE